jgi:hypothetical protein
MDDLPRTLRILCPVTAHPVDCTLLPGQRGGLPWVDVAACSAFACAADVHCRKPCVDMLNAGLWLESDGDG